MAREWLLRDVPQEELRQEEAKEPVTMTFGERVENFWYHSKFTILVVAFVVGVVAILIVNALTRERPDYVVCMGADKPVSESLVKELEQQLAAVGEDRNGDGETLVRIQKMEVGSEDPVLAQQSAAERQAVVSHFASHDVVLFFFSPDYHDSLVENLTKGEPLFEPLGFAEGTYYTYKVTDPETKQVLTFYAGVRGVPDDASENEKSDVEAAHELLRRFAVA